MVKRAMAKKATVKKAMARRAMVKKRKKSQQSQKRPLGMLQMRRRQKSCRTK